VIRSIHGLADGAPQLVHLWGWQFHGKDTGYPAVNIVDGCIGGYDGMMRVIERSKPLNATVSLSDNYDDVYRSSPEWNEALCDTKRLGPEASGEWYSQPGGGALSKHGVDVTSEGLRYPYIGKMSMCWYAGGPTPCPFGGKPLPMLSLIYRKSAVWGRAGNKGDLPLLLMMFYGEAQHNIFNGDVLNINAFERVQQRTTTTLEGSGNHIDIDWEKNSYSVTLHDAEAARDTLMSDIGTLKESYPAVPSIRSGIARRRASRRSMRCLWSSACSGIP